jgi:hypothetical protein
VILALGQSVRKHDLLQAAKTIKNAVSHPLYRNSLFFSLVLIQELEDQNSGLESPRFLTTRLVESIFVPLAAFGLASG